MSILEKIYKRPVTVCMAVLIALFGSIFFTSEMKVNLLPDMNMPYIAVTVVYPGASAESIETDVTDVLESALKTVSSINSVQTNSIDNAAIAVINFDYGVVLEKKVNEVKEKLEAATFPTGCYAPKITTVNFNGTAIATVSVFNVDGDEDKAYSDAVVLKERFNNIEGVGAVSLIGAPEKKVEIKPVCGLEMTTLLIVQALGGNSYDLPLGSVETNDGSISVRNVSAAKTLEELGETPVPLSLPTSLWGTIKKIQSLFLQFESATTTELNALKAQIDEVLDFIDELENMLDVELDSLYSNLTLLKAVNSLVSDDSAEELKTFWQETLKPIVESDEFRNASDESLQIIADSAGIDVRILKWFRDNDTVSLVGQIDALEASLGMAAKIDSNELKVVIEDLKRKNAGETDADGNLIKISNEQYARLFIGTELSQGVAANYQILEYIRSDSFPEKWAAIIEFKTAHQHALTEEEKAEYAEDDAPDFVADKMTDDDFYTVLGLSGLADKIPISITPELIKFIRNEDLTKITENSDGTGTLNVRLKNLSTITETAEKDSEAYYNDNKALSIEVYGKADSNTTEISKAVKEVIASVSIESKAILIDDQSDFISDSISNVLSSMLIGGVLAVLVIYLFLRSFKTSAIIAITMPLSVLCALSCLYFLNVSLNMVSLGGLAVGIGMLVDNSIVVIESISFERDKGKTAIESATDGVKIVAGSLIASTLTSVCVFFPILFTEGLTKEIFTDLSYAVILSLSFSLIVAITVIPTLYCLVYSDKQLLKGKIFARLKRVRKAKDSGANTSNGKHGKGKIILGIEKFYDLVMPKLLKKRWAVYLVAFVLFGSSVMLVFGAGMEFMPSVDKGQIKVAIEFSPSCKLDAAEAATVELKENIAQNVPNIEFLTATIGWTGMLQTNIIGTINIQLDTAKADTDKVTEQLRAWTEKVTLGSVSVTKMDGVVATLTSGMSGLGIDVCGDDVETLKEIGGKIRERLKELDYIRNVSDNLTDKVGEYVLKIDRNALAEKGVDYAVLVQTLRVGIAGLSPISIEIDGEMKDIYVSFSGETFKGYYDELEDFTIGFDSFGNPICLEDVATFTLVERSTIITRQDGKYVLSIGVEIYGTDTGNASKQILVISNEVLAEYDGYTGVEGGVNSYLTTAFEGLVIALIVSFLLLFAVMACQFESLVKPFIVIFAIPFSLTGGFLALVLTGTSLNVVSFIGIIMLMGVVVNNAILMIERISQLTKEGIKPFDAIIEGSKSRIRAILMTTLTTVLALVPLALGIGKGSELMQPLGIVVIGGLTLGTLVTLVLIPIVYASVNRRKLNQ